MDKLENTLNTLVDKAAKAKPADAERYSEAILNLSKSITILEPVIKRS